MMLIYEFKPDRYSSHIKILNLVRGNGLKILDVGCAYGYLAKELRQKGHEVYGIEADEDAAKQAKKYCKQVVVGDLDSLKLAYKSGFFDVMIFGDVLEHLKEPLSSLKRFLPFLKKEGYVIASTGNVANIYIRLNLLFGRFDYSDRGILDKTHLKLFTLKSFKQLIRDAGLRIIKTDVTPIPLPLVIKSTAEGKILHFLHAINYCFAKLWWKLFGFQFIIMAKKKQNEKL